MHPAVVFLVFPWVPLQIVVEPEEYIQPYPPADFIFVLFCVFLFLVSAIFVCCFFQEIT